MLFRRKHGVHPWDTKMTDLNDLQVFERVAALESFSAAGRALGMPKVHRKSLRRPT